MVLVGHLSAVSCAILGCLTRPITELEKCPDSRIIGTSGDTGGRRKMKRSLGRKVENKRGLQQAKRVLAQNDAETGTLTGRIVLIYAIVVSEMATVPKAKRQDWQDGAL